MDRLVSTSWLEKELGAPDLRVLDARVTFRFLDGGGFELGSGRSAWEESHIPGAQHVDIPGELSDPASAVPMMLPPAAQFAAAMERAGVGEGTRAVIYDGQFHMWAARVWWMLRAYGFDAAGILDGGWEAWQAEGRPVASGVDAPAAARFEARPRPGVFVTSADVLAATTTPEVAIVDALSPESYRGETQDYSRPGHIPSARNVPFSSLVDPETHRYLPRPGLEAAFSEALAGGPEQVITYCGGAVAASSAAFALGLIGVENVAVYDGSMLEWSADPSLPLVTGDE